MNKSNKFCLSKNILIISSMLFISLLVVIFSGVLNKSKPTTNTEAVEKSTITSRSISPTKPVEETIPNCQTLSDAYRFDEIIPGRVDFLTSNYQCGTVKSMRSRYLIMRPTCHLGFMCAHEASDTKTNYDSIKYIDKNLFNSQNPILSALMTAMSNGNGYNAIIPNNLGKYYLEINKKYTIYTSHSDNYILAPKQISGSLSCGNGSNLTKNISIGNNDDSLSPFGQILNITSIF